MWLFYSFTAEVTYNVCHNLPPFVNILVGTVVVLFYLFDQCVRLSFLNGYVVAIGVTLYVLFEICHSINILYMVLEVVAMQ